MQFNKERMGARIRELRKSSGMAVTELAETIGIDHSTLSNYEAGRKSPSNEIATRLCRYFDVSMDYLMGLTDDPTHHR